MWVLTFLFTVLQAHAFPSLWQKPVVLGASISAGHLTPSPGALLAERAGVRAHLIAQGGTPGAHLLKKVSLTTLTQASLVIAIDLFFWDSTLHSLNESFAALQQLIAITHRAQVPLLLGTIPEILPSHQPSRLALNHQLKALCADSCLLLPLDELYQQARHTGLSYQGRHYFLKDVLPDGLHLSRIGSEILAERVLSTLRDFEARRKSLF